MASAVSPAVSPTAASDPLRKWIVALVLAGMIGLLVEIRYDHQDVLARHPISWVPIIYSGLMFVVGAAALAAWNRGGRSVLAVGFFLAVVVGVLGFWEHNAGHFDRLTDYVTVWAKTPPPPRAHGAPPAGGGAEAASPTPDKLSSPPVPPSSAPETGGGSAQAATQAGASKAKKNNFLDAPPALAPLSFAGLGLVGLLACVGRDRVALRVSAP